MSTTSTLAGLLGLSALTLLPATRAATTSTQATANATVIQTKAELDRYLRNTPLGSSPLNTLTPGGRKRFLAGLQFYPHGAGLNYGAPAEELTNPQIVWLFALFGQQKLAEGLGLPEWNRKFPDQPLHVAWQYSDWPMIDHWSMPNYYIFRDGRLVKSFRGWKDLANLKQSLRETGALH